MLRQGFAPPGKFLETLSTEFGSKQIILTYACIYVFLIFLDKNVGPSLLLCRCASTTHPSPSRSPEKNTKGLKVGLHHLGSLKTGGRMSPPEGKWQTTVIVQVIHGQC